MGHVALDHRIMPVNYRFLFCASMSKVLVPPSRALSAQEPAPDIQLSGVRCFFLPFSFSLTASTIVGRPRIEARLKQQQQRPRC